MRGLAVFISDIRNCKSNISNVYVRQYLFFHLGKSRDAESRRINKELQNIRQKFRSKNRIFQMFSFFFFNEDFYSSG